MKSNRPIVNPRSSRDSRNVGPSPTTFPPAWLWLVDEVIPQWVKTQYSPRESWKDKPFSKEDSRFFFKGIEELSLLFTEERPRGMPAYFQHPKYRSSYLLYFMPLQMAKFMTVFQLHAQAIEAAVDHGIKEGVLRIADLGSGPGTASLAFLLLLLNFKLDPKKELPAIELYWFDTNKDTMTDGKALVEQLASNFPKLRNKVQVHTHVLPWWKAHTQLPSSLSLVLLGHVMNESQLPQNDFGPFWRNILKQANGGGILMIEPANRRSAQTLAHCRDTIFSEGWIESQPTQIWGPCTHAGICPLGGGRDWCHFSYPAHIPGQWFKSFSEGLSSERQWVKFSYLWLASADYPSPKLHPTMRRVVSDTLSQGTQATVLICEPETVGRLSLPAKNGVRRGQLVRV